MGVLSLWISWNSIPFALALLLGLWWQWPLPSPKSMAIPPHRPLNQINDPLCGFANIQHSFKHTRIYPKSERYLPTQRITSPSLHPDKGPILIRFCPHLSAGFPFIWLNLEFCTGVTEIMTIRVHKKQENKWIFLLRNTDKYALDNCDPNNKALLAFVCWILFCFC